MSDILDGDTCAAPIDAEDFRQAMSRVAAAVHVITTDGPAGRSGVTITAMTPVSDAPATVLFCLNQASRFEPLISKNRVFCVNTLCAGPANLALAEGFAGRDDLDTDARFALGSWTRLTTGAPALTSSRVALDCRVTAIQDIATHKVILGEVIDARLGTSDDALVYLQRDYRDL